MVKRERRHRPGCTKSASPSPGCTSPNCVHFFGRRLAELCGSSIITRVECLRRSPRSKSRNPAREVGLICLIFRPIGSPLCRLLVCYDEDVESKPAQHAVAEKTPITE